MATLTTLPTGRIESSAAAMPVRTAAPDAVVVPLQYAVAEKSSARARHGRAGIERARHGCPTEADRTSSLRRSASVRR